MARFDVQTGTAGLRAIGEAVPGTEWKFDWQVGEAGKVG